MLRSESPQSDDGEVVDSGNEGRNVSATSTGPPSVEAKKEERVGSGDAEERHGKEKKKKHHKHHREKERLPEDRPELSGDEEESLRRRLLEKREKDKKKERERTRTESDGEELFTIQPGADQKQKWQSSSREPDERKDRERERSRPAPRPLLDIRFDDRPPRHKEERWGSGRRVEEKRVRDKEREREKERDKNRDKPRQSKEDRERRHKRSKTRSRSPQRKRERRDRDKEERKEKKEAKEEDKLAEIAAEVLQKEEESEEMKMEGVEEASSATQLPRIEDAPSEGVEEEHALSAPVTPKQEVKKYSKFDSSPESDYAVVASPEQDFSDEEMEGVAGHELSDEEEDFDPSTMLWEEMTEEQRASLSPLTRERAEKEWQERLISALPVYYPGISGCRNVIEFDCLNRIEEGTFGVVYRAKDKRTDEVVALKRLKMEREKEGFPITSLREVNMLLKAGGHDNVVNVKEIVVGSNMDKIFLVMEFVEHDMKSLMEQMKKAGKKFSVGEQKTLLKQLLSGMQHLHDLWILHRDLKASNLLLSHQSVLKIGDFGLAREYGNPLKEYTQVVVTLWYRSPELLLGIKKYSTAVDMWSVGCIMAEFLLLSPLFPGKGEIDQVNKIFTELGTPSEKVWKGYDLLPGPKQVSFVQCQFNQLRKRFSSESLSEEGFRLLNSFLTYDPEKRVSAGKGLANKWFSEAPEPTPREFFPTWPAKSEGGKKPPTLPSAKTLSAAAASPTLAGRKKRDEAPPAFALKFDAPKF